MSNWAWRPTSRERNAIREGSRRFQRGRELLRSIRIGEPTMEQVQEALNTISDPVTSKPKRKPIVKKARNLKMPPKKKGAPKAKVATNGTPLKKLLPASMDARIARRKLRKAGLAGHDSRSRWEFAANQVAKVKEVLGIK